MKTLAAIALLSAFIAGGILTHWASRYELQLKTDLVVRPPVPTPTPFDPDAYLAGN